MEKSSSGKKKVMVAIDESEFSLYALEWTLQNFRETLQHSKIFIFTAQSLSELGFVYPSTFGAAPFELVQSVQENHKKTAEALLEKAKAISTQYGVDADTITEVGNAKEVICEAVEKLGVELLVLGSHGRQGLQRAFLGSVSNYCVHNAKCPVLVVKKNDSEKNE